MVISAAAFACLNAIVRYVDHLPTFQLVFFRAIGTVVCCLFILIRHRIPIAGNNKNLLILRSMVGFTSLILFYRAIQLMPLATAVSLRYLSPFFAALLAIYFLKEKMKKNQWVFFCTAFMGVLILKGFDHRVSIMALSFVMASSVFSGMVYVVIRKIGRSEHPVVVVNYFLSFSAVISGIVCLFVWVPPSIREWPFILTMGIFGFLGQLYMTKALQIAEANLISPFKYAEVIFTLIIGWLIFGEYQTWVALLGMLIIIVSLLGNVMIKGRGKVVRKM